MAKPFDGGVMLLLDLLDEVLDCGGCIRLLREEYDSGTAGAIANEGNVVVAFTY